MNLWIVVFEIDVASQRIRNWKMWLRKAMGITLNMYEHLVSNLSEEKKYIKQTIQGYTHIFSKFASHSAIHT